MSILIYQLLTNVPQLTVGRRYGGVEKMGTLHFLLFSQKPEPIQKVKSILKHLKLQITYCFKRNLTMELIGSNTDVNIFNKLDCIPVTSKIKNNHL